MYAPRGRHSECAQACEIAPLYRRGVEDAAPYRKNTGYLLLGDTRLCLYQLLWLVR